jgi:hypothetical protein
MLDAELQPLDSRVYGIVRWLETLSAGTCTATNATIGKYVHSSPSGVGNSLVRLRNRGYVHCQYDEQGWRTGINTLIRMTKTPYSNEEGGVTQMSNIKENNTKENILSISDDELTLVNRLYTGFLIEFYTDRSHYYDVAGKEERDAMVADATKKYRLTDKRRDLLLRRIRDKEIGFTMCRQAIKGYGSSEFHRGENNRNWKADLEFIFRNFENIEKGANKFKEGDGDG